MSRLPVDRLKKRVSNAWADTQNWNTYLDDAYSMARPGRNMFGGTRTEGSQPGNEIFDGTLQNSLTRFVNRIHSELFPAFMEWSRFIPGKTISIIDEEAKREIAAKADAATAVCFASIRTSNFSQAITEFLTDLAFGTGAMLVNPADSPSANSIMTCVTVNPGTLAFDNGPEGVVWGVFRKHEVIPELVQEIWPDAKMPDDWEGFRKRSQEGKNTVRLDEACYYSPKANVWYFDVLLSKDSPGVSSATRIVEREYKRSPWIIARWSRNTGETRGRGPVLEALPTAKSLNKAQELLLTSASVQIMPVMSYLDDGIFNPGTVSLLPGSFIPVGSNGGPRGPSLMKVDMGGDLGLAQFVFEDMRMQIKRFMLDDQLPPEQGSVRSATEWTARQKELFQNIGAPFGRLFTECIRPFMQRTLDIHVDAGVLEEMQVDGHVVDLQVTSPLAQGENMNDISAFAQASEMLGLINPALLKASLHEAKIAPWLFEKMGLGATHELLKTEEEAQETIDQLDSLESDAANQEQQNALELEETKQQGAA